LIPLIRRGVVHSRLRIGEHRKRVLRRDGKLGEQPDNQEVHGVGAGVSRLAVGVRRKGTATRSKIARLRRWASRARREECMPIAH